MKHLALAIHEPLGTHRQAWEIQRAIRYQEGVVRVYMHPSLGTAYVDYEPHITSPARLVTGLLRFGVRVSQLDDPTQALDIDADSTRRAESVRTRGAPPIEGLTAPFKVFARVEAAGGILLLGCTLVAVYLANTSWSGDYSNLWHVHIWLGVGDVGLTRPLVEWVNDGLMSMFFLVVGLEIKRELTAGELASVRKATLPLAAAMGGMLVPALIYTSLTIGTDGARGWGVPMATDIAFALGVMALLSGRIPVALKLYVVALAVVDDLGAVAVIALFYSDSVAVQPLGIAALVFTGLILANRLGVTALLPYLLGGIGLWFAVLQSGIHATMAGVLLAMTIPARARLRGVYEVTPLRRLEHNLHPWVVFAIVPLFALANAGVTLPGADSLVAAVGHPITLGVVLGLGVGKQVGIFGFSWLSVRAGLAALPEGVTWRQIYGASWLGGIGFTMSIFIASLAFPQTDLLDRAKIGILLASTIAGIVGWSVLRWMSRAERRLSTSDASVRRRQAAWAASGAASERR